jgi:hypothetical protein
MSLAADWCPGPTTAIVHNCASSVGTGRYYDGDASYNRKNGEQMQRIDGDPNLAEGSLPAGGHEKCVCFWLHKSKVRKSNIT